MAWKTEVAEKRAGKEFVVMSETLALAIAVNSSPSNWTSVIDFIPPGTDFTVIANSASANTSASTGVQLFIGWDKDATIANRERVQETPFISDTSQIDTARKRLKRDVSTYGQYPYYWLKCPGGGGVNVTFKVIYGGPEVAGALQ